MQDEKVLRGSPDRFGYEWARYAEILPESQQQLERWLGSTTLASYKGKTALDVGCGMGRNPYWMANAGAKVIAVDVDENSLRSARRNLAGIADVKKVSVYDLDPRLLGTFDRVSCIGVLHHLEDPALALSRLWGCVRPGGGELLLWCYAKEGNLMTLPFIQALRFLGSRMPIRATHFLAKFVALLTWPIFRLIPWSTEYYRNLRNLSFKNVESIIFDQMLPRIAHYWTRQDLQRMLQPLGGDARLEFVQGNSWHICVRKS